MNLKNSVVIICYNQERVISRALESILAQRDYVYEIVVSDDCSSDRTWDIVLEYCKQFPYLIKAHRNSINLGIFANYEAAVKRSTGDLTWHLSGDDAFSEGIFKRATRLVESKGVDVVNSAIVIYFDFVVVDHSGEGRVVSNRLVKRYNPVDLKIRGLIFNRSIGFSRKVLEKFYPVPKNIGLAADGLLDIQVQLFSDESYYDDHVGSIYFTGLGVSSSMCRRDYIESSVSASVYLEAALAPVSKENSQWINYSRQKLFTESDPTLRNFLKLLGASRCLALSYFGLYFIVRETRILLSLTLKVVRFYVLPK